MREAITPHFLVSSAARIKPSLILWTSHIPWFQRPYTNELIYDKVRRAQLSGGFLTSQMLRWGHCLTNALAADIFHTSDIKRQSALLLCAFIPSTLVHTIPYFHTPCR
jgi:hypothetical protein